MSRMDFHLIRRAIELRHQWTAAQLRNEKSRRVWTAAMTQARRDVSDEGAATALRLEIRDIPTDVLDRELSYSSFNNDYLDDRASRLLVAAHRGEPVAPIDPSKRIQFEQEAILGRLPLDDAFTRLVEAEPQLRTLEEIALTGKKVRSRDLDALVGPSARRSDTILRGETAHLIAIFYLDARAKGRNSGFKSLFEQSRSVVRGRVGPMPVDS